ncbi:MAG TPA: hypothetical protein VF045_01670, partial [Acidimicrobiales bacterium]
MAISPLTSDLGITRRRSRPGERVIVGVLFVCAVLSVLVTVGIIAVLAEETIRFFTKVSPVDFLTGTRWTPASGEGGRYGVLPLVNGSLMIALGSLVVGLPLGLATAIYLSEYARPRVRAVVKPVLEVLAGIPTVVVGFFALNF